MRIPLTALLSLSLLSAQDGDVGVVHAPLVPPSDSSEVEALDPPVGTSTPGEATDPARHGPSYVESMQAAIEREATREKEPEGYVHRMRNGARGTWTVPSRKSTRRALSGEHYATNKWGDTNMGLAFGAPVDLVGVWVAGQAEQPVWTSGLVVVGFRDGVEVARTPLFEEIGADYAWFPIDLEGVDRVEFQARAVHLGAGFYALDDLTFERAGERVVLTFDDLGWQEPLSGSDYGGIAWEEGSGDFEQDSYAIVRAPLSPPGNPDAADDDETGGETLLGGNGTLPSVGTSFVGPRIADNGAGWLPPDTHGAAGSAHFVSVVNQHMSVYDKATGVRLVNISLQSFFSTGGSAGDPRVSYDHFEGRWVVIASNFTSGSPAGCFLAYSLTDDATGQWFKTFVAMDGGSDSGRWCDYPLMGLDSNGIYLAGYMVGGSNRMSLFAIDKAPLLGNPPALGTVSAWRELPWEGAIQPCVTYGTPAGCYAVSRRSSTGLRLRVINPPLAAPTLTELGTVVVPLGSDPPSAPALGSTVNLSTVGTRLMNAVYRNGSVWTGHTIAKGMRAACRWYELDTATVTATQVGTVKDDELFYFFPGISVNANGDAVLGFTASSANMYAGAYYTGRLATDQLNHMAVPVSYKDGAGPYNSTQSGTNRWGDYSVSSVDPDNDLSIWTIQEYARVNNQWGTYIAELEFPTGCTGSAQNYCTGGLHSGGQTASMSQSGSRSIAVNAFSLEVSDAPANKTGIFFYGPNQVQTPFGDGFRCVGGSTFRLNPLIQTDALGGAARQVDFSLPPANAGNSQISANSTWNFQFWFRDPMGPLGNGFNLSDGLSVTFCP